MLGEIGSIRLKDLEIFQDVVRARSIREVARRRNTSSGQISKSIQNLERMVGTKLFKRSVSGVLLTSQGSELQLIVQELLNSGGRIESLVSGHEKPEFAKSIAIASTSFLNTRFTAPVVCHNAKLWPTTIFRFLDLAPDQIITVGLRGGFEIAIHLGSLAWPSTWVSKKLGKSSWKLCARTHHPLPKKPTLRQILEYPFAVPTYWTSEGLVRGNDQFPVPLSKRKMGYETATAEAAIPILLQTDHLAFLPELLVRPLLHQQDLRELKMEDLPTVEKDLYLTAKSDLVPAALFRQVCDKMTEELHRK